MHARVYKCTHCGRIGHLAKFYFDKINHINFTNKNVLVPNNANPRGPKRKWVPKFSPLVFDVGVGLSHDVRGLVPWWWMHELDAPLSRKFDGRTTMFGDLENSAYSLVTISKLLF